MKPIYLLLFLLLPSTIFCQRDLTNIMIRIELGSKYTQVYNADRDGCILGAFEIADSSEAWHANILPDKYFLTRNEFITTGDLEKKPENLDEISLKLFMDKLNGSSSWPSGNRQMVYFSFTPIKESVKRDSINFLFKYVYYKPESKKSIMQYTYNLKYGISFCTVAYDDLTNFKGLKEILPLLDIKIKTHYINFEEKQKLDNKEEIKYIDLAYYKNTIKEIEESVKKSKIDARQIKFSFEYIRTDKKNEQLILNKLNFPLVGSNTALMDAEYIKFPAAIYRGTLNSPLEFYEKDKNELLRQSPKWRFHNFTYDVLIIPLEKKGEELLCDVYFPSSTLIPLTYCYKKSMSFKLGERVKIALPEGHWYISDVSEGKNTVITEESFRNYVNEYYVLFVESMGEIKTLPNAVAFSKPAPANSTFQIYTITRFERLSDIASKYHVNVNDLKKWNNLKNGSKLSRGDKLIIKKPASK